MVLQQEQQWLSTSVQQIYASAQTEERIPEAKAAIVQLLRHRHRLATAADEDFLVRTQADISNTASTVTSALTSLLASIAGIPLLVGGIGIMNIMLVSVTERTREIGIRLATGAKGGDVLLQFLIEAVLLSVTGGLFR